MTTRRPDNLNTVGIVLLEFGFRSALTQNPSALGALLDGSLQEDHLKSILTLSSPEPKHPNMVAKTKITTEGASGRQPATERRIPYLNWVGICKLLHKEGKVPQSAPTPPETEKTAGVADSLQMQITALDELVKHVSKRMGL